MLASASSGSSVPSPVFAQSEKKQAENTNRPETGRKGPFAPPPPLHEETPPQPESNPRPFFLVKNSGPLAASSGTEGSEKQRQGEVLEQRPVIRKDSSLLQQQPRTATFGEPKGGRQTSSPSVSLSSSRPLERETSSVPPPESRQTTDRRNSLGTESVGKEKGPPPSSAGHAGAPSSTGGAISAPPSNTAVPPTHRQDPHTLTSRPVKSLSKESRSSRSSDGRVLVRSDTAADTIARHASEAFNRLTNEFEKDNQPLKGESSKEIHSEGPVPTNDARPDQLPPGQTSPTPPHLLSSSGQGKEQETTTPKGTMHRPPSRLPSSASSNTKGKSKQPSTQKESEKVSLVSLPADSPAPFSQKRNEGVDVQMDETTQNLPELPLAASPPSRKSSKNSKEESPPPHTDAPTPEPQTETFASSPAVPHKPHPTSSSPGPPSTHAERERERQREPEGPRVPLAAAPSRLLRSEDDVTESRPNSHSPEGGSLRSAHAPVAAPGPDTRTPADLLKPLQPRAAADQGSAAPSGSLYSSYSYTGSSRSGDSVSSRRKRTIRTGVHGSARPAGGGASRGGGLLSDDDDDSFRSGSIYSDDYTHSASSLAGSNRGGNGRDTEAWEAGTANSRNRLRRLMRDDKALIDALASDGRGFWLRVKRAEALLRAKNLVRGFAQGVRSKGRARGDGASDWRARVTPEEVAEATAEARGEGVLSRLPAEFLAAGLVGDAEESQDDERRGVAGCTLPSRLFRLKARLTKFRCQTFPASQGTGLALRGGGDSLALEESMEGPDIQFISFLDILTSCGKDASVEGNGEHLYPFPLAASQLEGNPSHSAGTGS
uniref:Uncharacterized protein n=1 Tax=Chromera velia CCMP2878 TaxID=1169474 RepID=A0A0G4HZR9_9ALVE|eukprot:Cvel_9767.t1-p1 / transcript=Cvel_9767.t1 / gene=Cvel_9767 / organism=Chromera_velia_CCMP2878 / gene_product=hypothetical protein / transcript_product=hypothetical protein / location=Cvel_scaffold572:35406-39027(+) / protein_length=828 / sequence_SO=supercontig / SO=protein_coding / is_pseudo=false